MKGLFRGAQTSGPAAAGAAPKPAFRRESLGFGPPRGSPEQLEMVSSLVQSAMRSAQGSESPIVSFLAPLLGSAAMGRASSLQDEARSAGLGDMSEALYGRGLTEEEMGLFDIVNNEDAPAMFREQARARLEAILAGAGAPGGMTPSPNPGGGGRSGGRSGGPSRAPAVPDAMPDFADDGVATLTDALAAGATPAPSVIAQLEATMNDPSATAQARTYAQRTLTSILEGAQSGEAVVGSRQPATPMLGVTPPSFGAPVTPMAQPQGSSNMPPPPPGTVPY
ncbi:MAG: hypothetical protein ACLFTP_09955 [Rhodosalinus sp.]